MNLSDCQLIKSEIGEYIPTEILEPNSLERHNKYPFISFVQKEVYYYKDSDGKIFKKTITNNKSTGKDIRLRERYNLLKNNKFGQEVNNNLLPIIDNPINVICKENKKNKSIKFPKKKIESNKKYKPIEDIINNNNKVSHKNNEFKKSTYIPTFINKQLEEESKLPNFKIIIKNLPVYYSIKDIDYILRERLVKFGEIKKLKLFKNNNDNSDNLIKDICFLEFQSMKNTIKLYESSEKIIIDNSILLIEKAK